MAKSLKDVLAGVKSSKIETPDLSDIHDYGKGAGKEFISKHKIEKHEDRVGNGDDVYKGKTKKASYKGSTNEEVNLEEGDQSMSSYGHAVKSLVDKYSEHNSHDSWSPAAPNTQKFIAGKSGKIEYKPSSSVSTSWGGQRTVHHAVHIGTNFPRDKAKEFKSEYDKIPRPSTGKIGDSTYKLHHDSTSGTNYSVHGLIKGNEIKEEFIEEGNKENKAKKKALKDIKKEKPMNKFDPREIFSAMKRGRVAEGSCNQSPAGTHCEMHGDADCSSKMETKKGKKLLLDKDKKVD